MNEKQPTTKTTKTLTYFHHAELYMLFHNMVYVILHQEDSALKSAAVSPCVIEGHVMNVDGSRLNITFLGSLPLHATIELFMDCFSSGVVIVKNLKIQIKEMLNIPIT